MVLRIALVGALAAALLAGCASDTVIVYGDEGGYAYHYSRGEFEYATRKGAIRTEVVGLPFHANPEALKTTVRGLMKGNNFGPPADFVATNSDRTDPVYKVVVAFNVATGWSGYDLCKDAAKVPTRGPGDPVTVDMAFCYGDTIESGVQGYVRHVAGLTDPVFAKLIHQTLLSLHPLQDNNRGREQVMP